VPALRSVGVGGMIVPVVSVLATLTLLPILLATVGERVDWPRRRRRRAVSSRAWASWARFVVRRRWLAALGALAVLTALGVAALGINLGEPAARSLGTATPAGRTLTALDQTGVPAGVLDPVEVLVPDRADAAGLARQLAHLPGVRTAVAPRGDAWRRAGTALISVQPIAEPTSAEGRATIERVRSFMERVPGARVGGSGPALLDQNHAFYGRFPMILGVVALITILLLARAFGSLLLAAKAVVLNLVSVSATFGAVVLVWQKGYGSHAIWNLPATGAITSWVPIIAFAFLFGLSMDYEVFILSRIREERDRTGSTTEGIVSGLGRTGRLVSCAALILFFAFAALSTAPQTDMKVTATALGVGILLDATVVRALLVPALVALLGRWNWWMPGWAGRLFQIPAPAGGPATYPTRVEGGVEGGVEGDKVR
jgi:RND superfamily putative drug exporter